MSICEGRTFYKKLFVLTVELDQRRENISKNNIAYHLLLDTNYQTEYKMAVVISNYATEYLSWWSVFPSKIFVVKR